MNFHGAFIIAGLITQTCIADDAPVLYAGTERGLYASLDGGATWSLNAALGQQPVTAIGLDSGDPGTVFAATANGVFLSSDRGASWRATRIGDAGPIVSLAIDALMPRRVYAAGQRLWRSTDSGLTWDRVEDLVAKPRELAVGAVPGAAYVSTSVGTYKTTDGGESWTLLRIAPDERLAIRPATGELFVAGEGGFFVAAADGRSWRHLGFPEPEALAPLTPVMFSGDVRALEFSFGGITSMALDPRANGPVYALGVGCIHLSIETFCGTGLLRKDRSWAGSKPPIDARGVHLHPTNPDIVYVSGRDGLYESQNGGATWQSVALPARLAINAFAAERHLAGITAIRNAASSTTAVAPGSVVSIFGANLAAGSTRPDAVPLPGVFAGTQVLVGGRPAELLYVSARQLNLVIPGEVAAGKTTIEVRGGERTVAASELQLNRTAPALFTLDGSGAGVAAAVNASTGERIDRANPARPGTTITLFGTGLGHADPGTIAVQLDNVQIDPEFARLAPALPGLFQLNVRIPQAMIEGILPIRITAEQIPSNTVEIPIRSAAGP